jgi:hypothetical protein
VVEYLPFAHKALGSISTKKKKKKEKKKKKKSGLNVIGHIYHPSI